MTKPVTPPYRIETERLVLRCYDPKDAAMLKKSVDESLDQLLPWMPWAKFEPQTLEEKITLVRGFRAHFDSDKDYIYAIFDRSERRLLGGTGLHTRRGPDAFETGYWVHSDETGKGIATEVSIVMTIQCLGHCRKDRMEIHCDPENKASVRIPEKLGFKLEAVRRRHDRGTQGDFRDTMVWTLLSTEYEQWPHRNFSFQAYDAIGRLLTG